MQKALKDDGPAGLLRFVPVQTVFECHDDDFHLDSNELLGRVFHHAEQHPPEETHA